MNYILSLWTIHSGLPQINQVTLGQLSKAICNYEDCNFGETQVLKKLLSLLSTEKWEPLDWGHFRPNFSRFPIYKTGTELPHIGFYPTVPYLGGKKWKYVRRTILSLFIRGTVCRTELRDYCMAHPIDRDVMLEKTKYEIFNPQTCLQKCVLFQNSL